MWKDLTQDNQTVGFPGRIKNHLLPLSSTSPLPILVFFK